jgi:hypothetical protein
VWFDAANPPKQPTIGDIMDTHKDIWDKTYRRDAVAGIKTISLMTVVSEYTPGERKLKAELEIATHSADVTVAATARMTPTQMRALADLLRLHADRVEHELIPLLSPTPEIIPFQLYHEPEAA